MSRINIVTFETANAEQKALLDAIQSQFHPGGDSPSRPGLRCFAEGRGDRKTGRRVWVASSFTDIDRDKCAK